MKEKFSSSLLFEVFWQGANFFSKIGDTTHVSSSLLEFFITIIWWLSFDDQDLPGQSLDFALKINFFTYFNNFLNYNLF